MLVTHVVPAAWAQPWLRNVPKMPRPWQNKCQTPPCSPTPPPPRPSPWRGASCCWWCQGKAGTAFRGMKPSEGCDASSWQGEELVETQQFLSAVLPDKQNMETNHLELSLLPSVVGGKRKCSIFHLSFLPFFFSFFANKTH